MTLVSGEGRFLEALGFNLSGNNNLFSLAEFRRLMLRKPVTPLVSGDTLLEVIGHCFINHGS
jgi:hypothetical protein